MMSYLIFINVFFALLAARVVERIFEAAIITIAVRWQKYKQRLKNGSN